MTEPLRSTSYPTWPARVRSYLSGRSALFWFSAVLIGIVVVMGIVVAPRSSPARTTILVSRLPAQGIQAPAARRISQVARDSRCDLVIFVATAAPQLPSIQPPKPTPSPTSVPSQSTAGTSKPPPSAEPSPPGSSGRGPSLGPTPQFGANGRTSEGRPPRSTTAASVPVSAPTARTPSEIVVVNRRGVAAIVAALPASVRILDESGRETRAGTSTGPQLVPLIVWAALVLLLGAVLGHAVAERWHGRRPEPIGLASLTLPRESPHVPAPAQALAPPASHHDSHDDWVPGDGLAPPEPMPYVGQITTSVADDLYGERVLIAGVGQDRPAIQAEILDKHVLRRGTRRHQPQCPTCGSFAVSTGDGSLTPGDAMGQYACGACLAQWQVLPGAPWPDLVIDPKKQHRP